VAPTNDTRSGDHSVDVIIPVLNEAHVLADSVSTVRAFLHDHLPHKSRVLIVDNGSTDGTDRVGQALERQYTDVEYLQLAQRGRGRALRHAWSHSGADVVCYTDVDLSTELAALPILVDAILNDGYDLGTGSRLMKESRTTRSTKREVISRIYNLFIKAVSDGSWMTSSRRSRTNRGFLIRNCWFLPRSGGTVSRICRWNGSKMTTAGSRSSPPLGRTSRVSCGFG